MTNTLPMPGKYISPQQGLLVLVIALILTCIAYISGLSEISRRWLSEDEYGHGPLLLLLAIYFAWQKRVEINNSHAESYKPGLILIIFASLLFVAGEISSLYILVHYAFVCTLYGLFIALYGLQVTRHIAPSLTLLIFAIPIPYFLQTELTISLQLLSSWIGVQIIQLFSIPVFLDGNVIDLGILKLQVVEACAGLRYMFSLLSFGFICAYVYRVAMWKRVVVFLSTIPITLLMNSARIAVVGILVNRSGIEMAEGFTHNFQGVTIFGICLILLFIEMWVLTRIGKEKSDFRSVFGLDFSTDTTQLSLNENRKLSSVFVAGLTIIILTSAAVTQFEGRSEEVPERTALIRFPLQLSGWEGSSQKLETDVLEKLKLDDYISADYRLVGKNIPVNFYVAYYESQRKGASPHSPRVCIPGGGWEISEIARQSQLLNSTGKNLHYNRAVIKKNGSTQLVYYWFQQRGRSIANEYFMKWYLFKDALIKNRTDGALVRLVTPILPYEDISAADERLLAFANVVVLPLGQYIPD